MSKADRWLEDLGYTAIVGSFNNWYLYYNLEKGSNIVFMDDIKSIKLNEETTISHKLLYVLNKKAEELGWFEGWFDEQSR